MIKKIGLVLLLHNALVLPVNIQSLKRCAPVFSGNTVRYYKVHENNLKEKDLAKTFYETVVSRPLLGKSDELKNILNDYKICENLLEQGCPVNSIIQGKPLVSWAVLYEKPLLVNLLVHYGVDFTLKESESGFTPLHIAIWYGQSNIAKYIIKKDPDVLQLPDHKGYKALELHKKTRDDLVYLEHNFSGYEYELWEKIYLKTGYHKIQSSQCIEKLKEEF